jgi:hypothetical protein
MLCSCKADPEKLDQASMMLEACGPADCQYGNWKLQEKYALNEYESRLAEDGYRLEKIGRGVDTRNGKSVNSLSYSNNNKKILITVRESSEVVSIEISD